MNNYYNPENTFYVRRLSQSRNKNCRASKQVVSQNRVLCPKLLCGCAFEYACLRARHGKGVNVSRRVRPRPRHEATRERDERRRTDRRQGRRRIQGNPDRRGAPHTVGPARLDGVSAARFL